MMGGDDLDDDQWNQPVRGSDDDDEGSDAGGAENGKHEIKTNKRKSELSKSTMTADDDREEAQQTKTKKQKSPAQLLLQAGRNIEQQDSIQQAAFLTTAVQHYSLLESQLENEGGDKAVAQMTKPNLEIMPHHCLGQADTTNCNTLIERIREAVAVKKMKQWKNVGSPCVVRE